MIKYVFCDLDGTIIHDFKEIKDRDIKALTEAKENNLEISFATGRLDYEIKHFNDLTDNNGFRISQNGAVVLNKQNEIELMNDLDASTINTIVNIVKAYECLYMFESIDKYIVPKKVKQLIDFEQYQDIIKYNEVPNILENLDKYKISSVSITMEKDQNSKVIESLRSKLPNGISACISSDYTIDIASDGISKGLAIKYICDKYEINPNEVAVIGDSFNDLSMFELFENSFVLAHAKEEVKKHGKYIIEDVATAIDLIINMNNKENN